MHIIIIYIFEKCCVIKKLCFFKKFYDESKAFNANSVKSDRSKLRSAVHKFLDRRFQLEQNKYLSSERDIEWTPFKLPEARCLHRRHCYS